MIYSYTVSITTSDRPRYRENLSYWKLYPAFWLYLTQRQLEEKIKNILYKSLVWIELLTHMIAEHDL